MSFGLGPMEVVILPMLGVGLLIWLGIPAILVYAGVAKSHGGLRAILLSTAGLYVLLFVIVPLVGVLGMASAKLESGGWSRVYHADGSCTERTSKNDQTSSVFHPQCPDPAPTPGRRSP